MSGWLEAPCTHYTLGVVNPPLMLTLFSFLMCLPRYLTTDWEVRGMRTTYFLSSFYHLSPLLFVHESFFFPLWSPRLPTTEWVERDLWTTDMFSPAPHTLTVTYPLFYFIFLTSQNIWRYLCKQEWKGWRNKKRDVTLDFLYKLEYTRYTYFMLQV